MKINKLVHLFVLWSRFCLLMGFILLSTQAMYSQSLIEDWNRVQDFYQQTNALKVKYIMTTSSTNYQEAQTIILSKLGNTYYYKLGTDMELSINKKSMLMINHLQKKIVRQPIPMKHDFGNQLLRADTLFQKYQSIIQYKGIQQGKRHYQIRPQKPDELIQADYFFTSKGKQTRFHKAVITYQYQGQQYTSVIKLETSTTLKDKTMFQEKHFVTLKQQQFSGVGAYKNYHVTDQRYED